MRLADVCSSGRDAGRELVTRLEGGRDLCSIGSPRRAPALEDVMVRPALLVVDMVNDFVTGVFGNPRSQAMVPRLAATLILVRAAGVPVIYCSDSHLAGVDVELTIHA